MSKISHRLCLAVEELSAARLKIKNLERLISSVVGILPVAIAKRQLPAVGRGPWAEVNENLICTTSK